MHWFYYTIRHVLLSWGYWALLLGLFVESLGLPLPGETLLMFASFLTHKQSGLRIQWVIPIGISAAVMGDNLGYWLGLHFGRTLIRWAKKILRRDDADIETAKRVIKTHGGRHHPFLAVHLRLTDGCGAYGRQPGHGVVALLQVQPLRRVTWVTAMAFIGYGFANEFDTLLGYIEKASWALAGGLLFTRYLIWRRQKHRYQQQQKA